MCSSLQMLHVCRWYTQPVCGLFGNEARRVGFQGRLPIFRTPPTAVASLPEGSVWWEGSLNAVVGVVDRHQEAGNHAVAFQRFLPRRSLAQGSAGREQPLPRASSSYRETQRESVTVRVPPPRQGREAQLSFGALKPKPDLGTILQAKRSSAKRTYSPLGKSGVHSSARWPSLLSALRRSVCQPCHIRCYRAQRSPASGHLSSFRLET